MFNWFKKKDTQFDLDDYRGPYEYQDVKEVLGMAHKYYNESEKVFLTLLSSLDHNEIQELAKEYEFHNKMAAMYVSSALAMVRRNNELYWEGFNTEKVFRKWWKYVGFKFPNLYLSEVLKNLQIAQVGKPIEDVKEVSHAIVDIEVPPGVYATDDIEISAYDNGGYQYFY